MIFYKEIRLAEIYIFEKRYTSYPGSRDNLVADDQYCDWSIQTMTLNPVLSVRRKLRERKVEVYTAHEMISFLETNWADCDQVNRRVAVSHKSSINCF